MASVAVLDSSAALAISQEARHGLASRDDGAEVHELLAHAGCKPSKNLWKTSAASKVQRRLALAVQHGDICTPLDEQLADLLIWREEQWRLPVSVASVNITLCSK